MKFGILFVYLFVLLLFGVPSFLRYMYIRFTDEEEEETNLEGLPRTRSVSICSSDLEQ